MTPRLPTNLVRIGRKAQFVIPAALRNAAGIKEGDLLTAEVDERGRVILTPRSRTERDEGTGE